MITCNCLYMHVYMYMYISRVHAYMYVFVIRYIEYVHVGGCDCICMSGHIHKPLHVYIKFYNSWYM